MRKFYLSCKFCTLTIILSEVVLPRHIPLKIIVFGKECFRNVLNASQRRVNKNSLTSWYVLKRSWRYLCKTSWKCCEDVLKTFFKTSWRRFEDAFARRPEDVLKAYGQDEYTGLDQDLLKTSSENVRPRQTYSSWSRRLENVFQTTSEEEDERRLQDVFIKKNVCWVISLTY